MSAPSPQTSPAGYLAWLRSPVDISTVILPDDAPIINQSYYMAVGMVHPGICRVSPWQYQHAVYNLATDILINLAPDQPGYEVFKETREKYKIHGFVPGVIGSSSNAGTAESLLNPEVFKGLLMSDLQNLKTPYGRAYLAIADNVGSNWGIS